MRNDSVQFQMELRKISRHCSLSSIYAELTHFTLFFLPRTAKKCTKIYNARAQPLFCSLNLLFGGVLVSCRHRRRGLFKLSNN